MALEMKLELVPVPVSDIDRAKAFYADLIGFSVDHDVRPTDTVRVVQLTPPGSACSIVLGAGLPGLEMAPGSLRGLYLVVPDLEATRGKFLPLLRDPDHSAGLGSPFPGAAAGDGSTFLERGAASRGEGGAIE